MALKLIKSSRGNPCPVCGRTKDGDCRITEEGVVFCHTETNGVPKGKQHPELDFVYCGTTQSGHECGMWKPLHLCEQPKKKREPAPTVYYDYFCWDGTQVPVQRYRKQTAKGKDVKWCGSLNGLSQSEIRPYRWELVLDQITAGEFLFIVKGEEKANQLAVRGMHAISVLGYSERLVTELRALVIDGITTVLAPDNDLADLHGWYGQLIAACPEAQTLLPPMRDMDWRYPNWSGGLGVEDWFKATNPSQEDIMRAVVAEPWKLGDGIEQELTPTVALATINADELEPADQSLLSYWGEGWTENKDGNTVATPLNAGTALNALRAAVPSNALRLNVVTGLVEVNSSPFDEVNLNTFYAEVQAQGWKITKESCIDAVLRIASQNKYDPIQEYLNYVAAADDIKPVDINKVSTDYLGTADDDYDLYMKTALLGAVKRRFEPGCQFDVVVTLDGEGRIGKSRVWISLASPDWHTSSDAESEKDFLMILHQAWIYEQAELDYLTGKRQVGLLKNLITTSKDSVRAPYGKGMESRFRQGIMVGTVNGPFLQGDEALRARFLVIHCPQSFQAGERIDFQRIAADRDRIWKAAVLAYHNGDQVHLTPEELARASNRNLEGSEQDHIWLGSISDWLSRPVNAQGPHTTDEILIGAGLRTKEKLSRPDQMELSRCMQQVGGWEKDDNSTRRNGKSGRYWRRVVT